MPKGRHISYLKARKLVSKGCIYHLVRVNDLSVEVPPIQSVPIVKEFLEIFPDNLPGVPIGGEINFDIDIIPDAHPTSITPYKMAPSELKEQLKDLLDKGFNSTKCLTLGRSSIDCEKERWFPTNVYRLPSIEQGYHQ